MYIRKRFYVYLIITLIIWGSVIKIQSNFKDNNDLKDDYFANMENSEELLDRVYKENQDFHNMEALNDQEVFQNVRVLLSTNDFQSYVHDRVRLSCDYDYTVSYGTYMDNYTAGEVFEITAHDMRLNAEKIHIESVNSGGKIQILSLDRVCGNPQYRGKIELSFHEGGIIIVNELPIEAYLYGVIPSEMPVSYGLEAMKVQAVCARSFVYTSMNNESKFSEYDADVDDSTSSQVYMNIGEDSLAIEAVDATKNQVLCVNDDIVRTYFFSTSCGVTSNVSDVWGGVEQTYLVPVFQNMSGTQSNLKDEESFRRFIDLSDEQNYYENNVSWFRWSVTLDSTAIKKGFSKVGKSYKEGSIDGRITAIEVVERGESGIAKVLKIYSENSIGIVYGEYSIRVTLNVNNQTIVCHDDSEITNQTILPSGYFYIDQIKDSQFKICGGGFGHGVGLSQNGAAAMCNAGMDYVQVLNHFFAGAQVKLLQGY